MANELPDVLKMSETEWAAHLNSMGSRAIQCFGRAWMVRAGEPAARLAYARTDDDLFDAIISMIDTPDPKLTMEIGSAEYPIQISFELMGPAFAQLCLTAAQKAEDANEQDKINYRTLFKALVIDNDLTSEDMRRLRMRLAQVANQRPTTPQ